MQFAFAQAALPQTGTVAITVAADRSLGEVGRKLDQSTGGALTRAMNASRFTGKREETLTILAPSGVDLDRLLLIGIGKIADVSELTLQAIGGTLVATLDKSGATAVSVLADLPTDAPLSGGRAAAELLFGARLRSYRFDKYRTTEKPENRSALASITALTDAVDEAAATWKVLEGLAESIEFARDLVTEPANVINPVTMAERCRDLAGVGITVEVLDQAALEDLKMGALLGVAQGSAIEPRIVVMRYDGAPAGTDAEAARPLAFVGKGVTFDTGGISIKPAGGMEDMKWDMGGAAVVIGTMRALAARKAKVNAIGIVGLVENMPSGTAQRPGDVVTSANGQTIEVINTDAEGRLVLADCLWYAQDRFNPRLIIDLATLTGAIIIALGHDHAGLFTNNDELAGGLTKAGLAVGEAVWRLPMGDSYDKLINSDIADIKNVGGGRDAGSITAAQFLKRFITSDVAWAHIDIAGVAWSKKDAATTPKGATAFGVRLLDRYVADSHEA